MLLLLQRENLQVQIYFSFQGQLGGAFASAIKSGGSLLKDLGGAAKSAGQGFENEWDRTRKTPLLVCNRLCQDLLADYSTDDI